MSSIDSFNSCNYISGHSSKALKDGTQLHQKGNARHSKENHKLSRKKTDCKISNSVFKKNTTPAQASHSSSFSSLSSTSSSSSSPTLINIHNCKNFGKRQLGHTTQKSLHNQENNAESDQQSKKYKSSQSSLAPEIQDFVTPRVINNRKRKASREVTESLKQPIKKSAIDTKPPLSGGEPANQQDDVFNTGVHSPVKTSDDVVSSSAELTNFKPATETTSVGENKLAIKLIPHSSNLICNISSNLLKNSVSLCRKVFTRTFATQVKRNLSKMPLHLSQANWSNISRILNHSQNRIDTTFETLSPILKVAALIKMIVDYDPNKCNNIIKALEEEFYVSDFVREVAKSVTVLDLRKYPKKIKYLSKLSNVFDVKVLTMPDFTVGNDLKDIARLSNLQELNIKNHIITDTDFDDLITFKNLRKIKFNAENISNASLALLVKNLTNLEALDLLQCTKITDLNPLSGIIALKYLRLHNSTQINDISPLANLAKLKHLDLSCGMFENRALIDIGQLEKLTDLETLNLGGLKSITDISSLTNLVNLKNLDLSYCSQIADISTLANLSSLEALNLSGLHITDFSLLANLVNLKHLNLSSCAIEDISTLANISSLEALYISDCNKITDISPLAHLVNLKHLDLASCEQITDISTLSSLSSLETLRLSHKITDVSPLAHLVNLTNLTLRECKRIRDISPLACLAKLKHLDLSCGMYENHALIDIRQLEKLTDLETLNLGGLKSITDISSLTNLVNLKNLDLSYCEQIKDVSPLLSLTDLENLNISGCKLISDSNLVKLAELRNLKKLYIFGTIISYNSTLEIEKTNPLLKVIGMWY